MKELVYLLAGAVGKSITFNSLRKSIDVGSATTVSDYCGYLQSSYLCFFVTAYHPSLRQKMLLPKKVYFIDHVLAQVVGFRPSEDRGRLLENQVFIELKRRSTEIYYHKGKGECDFVLRKGVNIIAAIQVCKELDNPETRAREIEGLQDAMKTYDLREGLILTENQEGALEEEMFRIRILPIWKWMIQRDHEDPEV